MSAGTVRQKQYPETDFSVSPKVFLRTENRELRTFYPGGHCSERPPIKCTCRWKTDCPERGPTFTTVR
jgi:hypothetical protein